MRSVPGLMLLLTLVDDPLFGGAIVAARLAFGPTGTLAALGAFVLASIGMAASTAAALRAEPLYLSAKNRSRIEALQQRRLGSHLLPHPDRPLAAIAAAVIFGSVAPIIAAALHPDHEPANSSRMVILCGVSYGVAFATTYGLLGALVGVVTS